MKGFRFLCLVSILTVLPALGCEDDTIRDCWDCRCDPSYCGGPQRFENLSEKWHVLNNIELAHIKRRVDKYEELLDASFTFFLSPADVGHGLPAQWDRAVEITANTNLFSADPPDPFPRCKDIDMAIMWDDSEGRPSLAWVEIDGPNEEKWYTTTVYYDFQIDVEPDMTYLNNPGAKAQFTVRNAGTEEAPLWKLVEMHDLGDPELTTQAVASTESSTWGSIKAIYRQ